MLDERATWPPPGDSPFLILVPNNAQNSTGVVPALAPQNPQELPLILALSIPLPLVARRRDVAWAVAHFARQYAGYEEHHRRSSILGNGRTFIVKAEYVTRAIRHGKGDCDSFWHGMEVL